MYHLSDVRIGKEHSVKLSFMAKFAFCFYFRSIQELVFMQVFLFLFFLNYASSSSKRCNPYLQNLSCLFLIPFGYNDLLIQMCVEYNLL